MSAIPLLWRLIAAALLAVGAVGGVLLWKASIYNAGIAHERARTEAQNRKVVNEVVHNLDSVRDCHRTDGMRWNQSTRQCERGL